MGNCESVDGGIRRPAASSWLGTSPSATYFFLGYWLSMVGSITSLGLADTSHRRASSRLGCGAERSPNLSQARSPAVEQKEGAEHPCR